MNVDPAAEAEFNDWYDAEHLPQLRAVPGVLAARRFRATDLTSERRYLALYHLRDTAHGNDWPAARTRTGPAERPHLTRSAGYPDEAVSAGGLSRGGFVCGRVRAARLAHGVEAGEVICGAKIGWDMAVTPAPDAAIAGIGFRRHGSLSTG